MTFPSFHCSPHLICINTLLFSLRRCPHLLVPWEKLWSSEWMSWIFPSACSFSFCLEAPPSFCPHKLETWNLIFSLSFSSLSPLDNNQILPFLLFSLGVFGIASVKVTWTIEFFSQFTFPPAASHHTILALYCSWSNKSPTIKPLLKIFQWLPTPVTSGCPCSFRVLLAFNTRFSCFEISHTHRYTYTQLHPL